MRAKLAVLGLVMAIVVILAPSAHEVRAQQPTVDAVLKRVGLSLNILRGGTEEDSLMMMEWWATGTMRPITPTALGPESKVKIYGSIAFDMSGMRLDITRTGADGKPAREIQVVSGAHAWNEEGEIGAGLTPGFGKAIPMMDAVSERLILLYSLPHGVYKAAVAAGPAAKLMVKGNTGTITFPLTSQPKRLLEASWVVAGPAEGAQVTMSINPQLRPDKVDIRHGAKLYEMTLAEYGDYNDKDYLSDVQFARRITRKIDGQTVLDLTVDRTNTFNPYIVMPVPDNVLKAGGGK